MIRRAFTMRLKPGAEAEYRHHHDNVWPELVKEIEKSGIASITTFQRGLDLFLVSEISDAAAWDKLWTSEIHRRWADVMEPLMNLREDGIVDAGPLEEIFHLSTGAGRKNGKPGNKKPAVKAKTRTAKPAPKKSTKTPEAQKSAKKTAKPKKKAGARR